MTPVMITAQQSLRAGGMLGIAVQPVVDHIVVELFGPQQSRMGLPHDQFFRFGHGLRDDGSREFIRFPASLFHDFSEFRP
ncbi:hypothetical protein DKP78_20330, partial [Enterococcus faecium]